LLRNPPNMDEHKQATTQPSFESASSIKLPARVITYAWGDAYVEDLLSLTIPALLAAGNLPYLASQVSCEVVMLTEERLFARVSAHPAIERIRAICPFKLIGLDDLITAPDKKYGMALTYALHRGFADLGAAMTDHWLIFLNADFVLAEGSLRNLLDHLVRGERLVASPSYCVVAKETKPDLLKRVDPKTRTLSMAPREMAKLALAHRHNTIRSKTVNQNTFHIRYMEQFYWLLDDSTLLGHQMPVAIVGLRPECYVAEPNSYWDHGLMREFCPTAEPDVIGDSDEFLMIELREQEVAHDDILPGWPQPVDLMGDTLSKRLCALSAHSPRGRRARKCRRRPSNAQRLRKRSDVPRAGKFAVARWAPAMGPPLDGLRGCAISVPILPAGTAHGEHGAAQPFCQGRSSLVEARRATEAATSPAGGEHRNDGSSARTHPT
jgi:hypothetical protein